jgi:hypothetical protein
MRGKLREWQLAIHDTALLPEAERDQRAKANNTTIYQMVRDPKLYDLPAYLNAADLALSKNPANSGRFVMMLVSKDSAIRYWGTVGFLMLGKADANAQTALSTVLNDECGEVSAMAAWVLIQSGNTAQAEKALAGMIEHHSPATLMALNVLDWAHVDLKPFVSAINALADGKEKLTEYEQRMVEFLRDSHGLPNPKGAGKGGKRKGKGPPVDKADL